MECNCNGLMLPTSWQMASRLSIISCCIMAITAASFEKPYLYSYENNRKAIIQNESSFITGGRLNLNFMESRADEIFLKYKCHELEKGFEDPDKHAASMHFFRAKPLIDASKVFKFLQKMPKGAVLHAHTSATVSSDWVVKNILYMDGLLRCVTKEGLNILTFRQQPEEHGCNTNYVDVNLERQLSLSIAEYDRALESFINLYTPTPELEHSTINKVWTKFQNMFKTMSDVLKYQPAYVAYHWQMLEELYNDNVMYAEVRLGFDELYNLKGHKFPIESTVKMLIDIIEEFKRIRPNFFGIKMIYAINRRADDYKIRQRFKIFKKLHCLYPNYIVGFDLVGQEDMGKPLHNFVDMLNDKPKNSKFFFHAGETNWYGASMDYNLFDAILLNTTRIGHGYALMKHPLLYSAAKDRGIAIEVNPISNQILKLVWDLRNHPGSFYISQNLPIVICNDDPGFWNAKALSYDFYYAIMSLAPFNAGLRTLKQLVWNSIEYSTLDQIEKKQAYGLLEKQWHEFIQEVFQS